MDHQITVMRVDINMEAKSAEDRKQTANTNLMQDIRRDETLHPTNLQIKDSFIHFLKYNVTGFGIQKICKEELPFSILYP